MIDYRLSKLLMGAPQTLSPPGGGLAQLLQQGLPMGGGVGQGAYPPPPPVDLGQPAAQPASGGGFLDNLLSPEVALPMAGALMSGPTFGAGMGQALTGAGPAIAGLRDKNRSKAYLSQNFPELAAMSDAGAPMDVLWKAALAKRGIGKDTSYSSPTLMTKPDGSQTYVMFGNDGTLKPLETGDLKPGKTTTRDLGTAWGVVDAGGSLIGTIPKDVYGAGEQHAEGTAVGKSTGEAKAAYNSMAAKMPGLENVVKQLDDISNRATFTWTGQMTDTIRRQAGAEPRDSAIARQQYISMVDNQILPLLRDTFGAQFTEREGATLRATLGNPDLHPKEKQAVLRAFIEQKRRDVEALARQSGVDAPAYTPPPDALTTTPAPNAAPRLRYNPDTGELEPQ